MFPDGYLYMSKRLTKYDVADGFLTQPIDALKIMAACYFNIIISKDGTEFTFQ
jgi:homoserine acetyltransferase